jgi:FAD/FMN-containing dehydrogenase
MDLVNELRALLGDAGVLDATEVAKRSAGAWRPDNLKASALARPASTAEVSAVLRLCHARGITVVPQGGLTGLVHGADTEPGQVVLSTERMRAIEQIDPLQRTATVQAGVSLQALQDAADAQQLLFPVDFGARGTATLGGVAATNAGGNSVIRYGMAREQVLGLEAVLADGTVVSSLNTLIKNNTGYDLKHVFIGSEGTLGVITRLVLRLREKPTTTNTAFVGLGDFDSVAQFLKHMDRSLGGTLSAFEVMWQPFYVHVTTAPAKGRPPISQDYAYYVLVESQGSDRELDTQRFNGAMESAFEAGLVLDAAIAQSEADSQGFWALRDDFEALLHGGLPFVFDISLPIAEMAGYVRGLQAGLPGAVGEDHRLFVFGHLGDGNLHVIVQVKPAVFLTGRSKVEEVVYRGLERFRGAVSAEHGIGLEKKPWLTISRNEQEIALMRSIKTAFDPQDRMNPGKIL